MPLPAAALHARDGRRIAAAAIAVALQGAFFWLILQEPVEPTAPPGATPREITILQTAGRLRPTTLPLKRRLKVLRRLAAPKEASPPAEIMEPITLPRAPEPAPHAPADWRQALQGEVRAEESPSQTGKLRFGFPQPSPAGPVAAPEFGWDYARTHRVEALPEGGMLLNLSDRCALVIYGFLIIPGCRIGRIPANGHLFERMRDGPSEHVAGLP